MPQQLSISPVGTYSGALNRKVPFTAFLEYTYLKGKRFESIRDFEKAADLIEVSLDTLCTDGVFDYSKPIAFTKQFGDYPARFTVNGFYCAVHDSLFDNEPFGTQLVINSGSFKTGPSLNQAARIPRSSLNDIVSDIVSRLSSATGLSVWRLNVAGFVFGDSGSHFPS